MGKQAASVCCRLHQLNHADSKGSEDHPFFETKRAQTDKPQRSKLTTTGDQGEHVSYSEFRATTGIGPQEQHIAAIVTSTPPARLQEDFISLSKCQGNQ